MNLLKEKLERLRNENIPESERKQILSLFHRSDLEFKIKEELVSQLYQAEPGNESDQQNWQQFDKLWNKIQHKSRDKYLNRFKQRYLYYAAAVLITALLAGNILLHSFHSHEKLYHTAIAPSGSIGEVIMPDSSIIYLNSGTKIRYAMDKKKHVREVFLDGEAWFHVEKADKLPLVVHTPSYDIWVTGTKFNVKAYSSENEITTTLEEGQIQIVSSQQHSFSEKISMTPGEQITFHKEERRLHIKKVSPELYSTWKENKLIFINTCLKKLIVLLERKYAVEITVEDAEILNYHYDGTIKNETIIEVLEILQRTLPIKYTISNQKIRIKKIKEEPYVKKI